MIWPCFGCAIWAVSLKALSVSRRVFAACREDYVDADNPVRIIDAFVDELDLAGFGFGRIQPASPGRPGGAAHRAPDRAIGITARPG